MVPAFPTSRYSAKTNGDNQALGGLFMHPVRAMAAAVLAAAALVVSALGSPASAAPSATLTPGTPEFNGIVHAMTVYNDVIYVGGSFTQATQGGQHVTNHLAAIDARTGALITSWAPNVNGNVYALAAGRDGLYVGGTFSSVNGRGYTNLARLSLANGAPATASFHPRVNHGVYAIALAPARIFIGGSFTKVRSLTRKRLAAFDRASLAVTRWRPSADRRVMVLRNQRFSVIAGGFFAHVNGNVKAGHLTMISKRTGYNVRGWDAPVTYPVFDVRVGPYRMYVGTGGPGGHVFSLGRKHGGQLWNATFDGDVQAVTAMSGRVYVGGHFLAKCATNRTGNNGACRANEAMRSKLAALDLGGKLQAWAPVVGPSGSEGVMAMRPVSTGGLAVGGAFSSVDTAKALGFALFAPV